MKKKQSVDSKGVEGLIKVLFIIIILIIVLFVILGGGKEDLNDGESAYDFCVLKCDGKDVASTMNSTKYNFVRCDCVVGVNRGVGKYSNDYPVTEPIYFDSESELGISRDVVGNRIENKNS